MTALASTDVTVAIPVQERDIAPESPKLQSMATLTFGDGSLTYPSGGVPLPDKSQFGFKRAIEIGLIEQASANAGEHRYDRTNHKIRIFEAGTELTGGAAPAARSIKVLFIGQ